MPQPQLPSSNCFLINSNKWINAWVIIECFERVNKLNV